MNTTISKSTLRPGFLVSLKTSVRGNVHYLKTPIEAVKDETPGAAPDAVQVVKWETTRTITDPVEHEAAKKARSKAAGLVRSFCSKSAFGLLCPEVDSERLEKAFAEAKKTIEEFNDGAKLSRISIYVLTGRVMPDDVEAVRAINSEIRELMADMAAGIEVGNVESIREAASRVKGIGEMLSVEAQAKVQLAVETGRAVAKKLVKDGPADVDNSAIRRIQELRTAFLDLDDADEVSVPEGAAPRLDFERAGA